MIPRGGRGHKRIAQAHAVRSRANRGIALIIVSSLLVLLAVAAASLLSLASGLRQRSAINIDHETARLLARSGVAYAYSRLTNPFARAEAADDWAYRDSPGVPLEQAQNPSYARGEPYADLDKNGRYDPGYDAMVDWNGNGRFDVWSGRLRGRHGLADATFALKIASSEAGIDINGGTLSMEDTDNNKKPDYHDWLTVKERNEAGQGDDQFTTRGIPAIRNMHSSEVINLLGEVIYDAEIVKPPASIMQTGDVLLQTRPPGGCRSLEEARAWIAPEVWGKIGPYLSTRGSRTGAVWGKMVTYGSNIPPRTDLAQAIDVNVADRFLLQALFLRYVLAPAPITSTSPDFILSRETAGRIADFLVASRPFASRYDLFRKLDAAKGTVFPLSAGTSINAVFGLHEQNAAVSFVAGLAEGAPGSFNILGYAEESQSDFPFFSWATYDLPRATASGAEPRWPRFEDYAEAPLRFIRASYRGASASNYPPGSFYLNPYAQLLPLSLDSGDAFSVSVESLGRVGGAGARRALAALYVPSLHVADIVTATGQNDFENQEERIRPWETADGPLTPSNRGGHVRLNTRETRRLAGGVELRGRPGKRRTQTWPGYPLDSCPDYVQGSEFTWDKWPALGYYPRDHIGNVALMPYAGRFYGGEFFYMPCWEKGGENGQPLRDPSHPLQSVAENFANLITTPSSTGGGIVLPNSHWRDITLKQWSAASSGPLLARRPTTIPLDTAHQWAFKDFPWIDSNGAFQGGTFDYWGMVVSMKLYHDVSPISSSWLPYLSSAISSTVVTVTGQTNNGSSTDSPTITYKSVGSYAPFTPHRVTLVMGSTVQGNVDGTPDPGLFGDFQTDAPNPNRKFTFVMESGGEIAAGYRGTLGDLGGGVRASAEHWLSDKIRAVALQDPYFWTSDAHPDVPGIPSFTSPLYVFPEPARLASASWDGFVPAKIRDADPGSAPLRVELLMYADEWATPGTEQVLPLPAEGWRTGGESVDLGKTWAKSHSGDRLPQTRSFRYRIWFDSSAMGGAGNETPVFNSIRIAYRGGQKLEGMEWR